MFYFANVTNLDKARFAFFPLGAVEECSHGTLLFFSFLFFFLFTSAHFVSGYNSPQTMPPYISYFIFSLCKFW